MPRTTSEVLTGPGTLYVAPDNEAFPLTPDTAPSVNYKDIGYSESGWNLVVDKDFENIEVAEEVDPIDVRKTGQTARMRGEAAQFSLEVLQEAMGGGTITVDTVAGTKTYVPPASNVVARRTLLFRTSAPAVGGAARNRDIRVTHAVATGGIDTPHDKAPAKSLLGIDFQMVKVSGDNLFSIMDKT